MPISSNPIKVVVPTGAKLIVEFKETDGTFTIDFDSNNDHTLRVIASMPDSSGRYGAIYEDRFESDTIDSVSEEVPSQYKFAWPRE